MNHSSPIWVWMSHSDTYVIYEKDNHSDSTGMLYAAFFFFLSSIFDALDKFRFYSIDILENSCINASFNLCTNVNRNKFGKSFGLLICYFFFRCLSRYFAVGIDPDMENITFDIFVCRSMAHRGARKRDTKRRLDEGMKEWPNWNWLAVMFIPYISRIFADNSIRHIFMRKSRKKKQFW